MAERTWADANVVAQTTDDQALLATMRERFHQAEEAESRTRAKELEDLEFSHGEQWPTDIANRRRLDNRPCLTINQMPQYIRQVTNEQRQNRPAIRVLPVDDFADPATAKVLQGLIRHIETDSDAEVAYDTAFEQAVRSGKGYFRILTEYESPQSFEQVIKLRRIRNRFTVYTDPTSQEPDGSDMRWALLVEEMAREVFLAEWPQAQLSGLAGWTSAGDGWIRRETVRLCEYFFRQDVQQEIVLLDDNTVHETRFLPADERRAIVARREAWFPEVWWVKSNGYEVLERVRFPSRYIPIIPVCGDESDIRGQIEYAGLVRHAKDAQRMYNFWAASETETIALAPRTPWIGAEGQFEGHEQEWVAANQRNLAFLEYKPTTLSGQLVPPPQRQTFEPPIQAITQARLMSRDDLKATTGIYDASLGARGNETSGRAILARQREGDVSNFHYVDNLARALRHTGRILLDMIPQLYSGKRVLRILGEDNTPQTVVLNATFRDQQGIEQLYQVGVGRYDVVVDVGPSYATKRQETVATMMELTKIYPALFQVAGDLLIKSMDWPGAQEISERLMTLLPPELRPTQQTGDPKTQLAQLQAAMPQLQQRLQALNEYAKQCETQVQEARQEAEQLKQSAVVKTAELTLRQEETHAKVQLDGQRLVLEQAKLALDEQRLALEVAKAQADIGDAQTRTLAEIQQQDGAMHMMQQVCQTVGETLTTIQEQLQEMQARLGALQAEEAAERAARQAPKAVQLSRRPDGTLVGEVTQGGQVTRHIAVTPGENGISGEMTT